MKQITVRLLIAGSLLMLPGFVAAQGTAPMPGDHTPIVHDHTPSIHDHGAPSGPHK